MNFNPEVIVTVLNSWATLLLLLAVGFSVIYFGAPILKEQRLRELKKKKL